MTGRDPTRARDRGRTSASELEDLYQIPGRLPDIVTRVARDDSKWTVFNGDEGDITATYLEWQEIGVMPPGLTWGELHDRAADWEVAFDAFLNPTSGGRGGRTRAAYVRPDDSLVRNAVEGAWDALTGSVDAAGVDNAIKVFYSKDRANYDNEGQQIDAMEAVLELIRNTPEYKEIHQLRSESQDERTWISSKVGRLLQAGVSQPLAQELGAAQAQVGASDPTTARAAEIGTLVGTGRALDSHKARMRDSMGAALGLL
jgi:hypothetical protein